MSPPQTGSSAMAPAGAGAGAGGALGLTPEGKMRE